MNVKTLYNICSLKQIVTSEYCIYDMYFTYTIVCVHSLPWIACTNSAVSSCLPDKHRRKKSVKDIAIRVCLAPALLGEGM